MGMRRVTVTDLLLVVGAGLVLLGAITPWLVESTAMVRGWIVLSDEPAAESGVIGLYITSPLLLVLSAGFLAIVFRQLVARQDSAQSTHLPNLGLGLAFVTAVVVIHSVPATSTPTREIALLLLGAGLLAVPRVCTALANVFARQRDTTQLEAEAK